MVSGCWLGPIFTVLGSTGLSMIIIGLYHHFRFRSQKDSQQVGQSDCLEKRRAVRYLKQSVVGRGQSWCECGSMDGRAAGGLVIFLQVLGLGVRMRFTIQLTKAPNARVKDPSVTQSFKRAGKK